MKDTVAGAALAIVFLTLLFAAPRLLPRGIEGVTRAEASHVAPGFSGTQMLGSWMLQCSAASVSRNGTAAAPTQSSAVGRCRTARRYRDGNGQLVLAIAFRYAGPARTLTMIVLYPPLGGKGQYLVLGLAPKASLRLPVFGCTKISCVAVGALMPAAQSLLTGSPQAQVVLPRTADGKQYSVGVRLDGLGQALEGMRRAEL